MDIGTVEQYLGAEHSWDFYTVSSAYQAELSAQAAVCRIPTTRPGRWWAEPSYADYGLIPVALLTAGDVFLYVGSGDTFTWNGAAWVYVGPTDLPRPDGFVIPGVPFYPDDLTEALCRRVAVNLAIRALPLGLSSAMSEAYVSQSRVGGGDREVKRLEAPYRRRSVG